MNPYCEFALNRPPEDVHKVYHDRFYGFPVRNDNALFGRLILEINQAGLSWETILKKEKNFEAAYNQFDIEAIANYDESDRERLLSDSGIIRNRLKINAAIYNAQQVLEIQKNFGSFKNWLDVNQSLKLDEWVKLFKQHMKFVGGEIVNEFLMSSGYLAGAHSEDCPIYKLITEDNPAWMK